MCLRCVYTNTQTKEENVVLIWCGMLIYPTAMRTADGITHQFVANGCLVRHIMNPRPLHVADNDNEGRAA